MKKLFNLYLAIFASSNLASQSLPTEFNYDWSKAGLTETIVYDTIEATDYGFIGDSTTSNSNAWASLSATLGQTPTVVHFPAGNFVFTNQVALPTKTVLTGEGSDQTRLLFNFTGDYVDLIRISGNISPTKTYLDVTASRGAKTIKVNTTALTIGDWLYVNDVDTALAFSSWADGYDGQIVRIDSLWSDSIYINQVLRRNYTVLNASFVQKILVKENSGVSCLGLFNQTPSVAIQRSNILISYAVNCFVKGIESVNADFGHVSTERSAFCEISGNYFHHATAYGSGGQGYGINLQLGASDYFVHDNNFDHLRHSMLLQSGCNGNVFRHNYSTDAYYSQFPTNYAGDIVLHGNYPYLNLFEENVANNIYVDASHGKNGPFNVFLRNRAKLYGIIMSTGPASDSTAFIGNEITSSAQFTGNYTLNGIGNYAFGNNKQGTVLPTGTSNVSLISIFDSLAANPLIGFPNSLNQQAIPLETYRSFGIYTSCADSVILPVNIEQVERKKIIFKNPISNTLEINNANWIQKVFITDAIGRQVLSFENFEKVNILTLNTSQLLAGIYYAEIKSESTTVNLKFVKE